MRNEFIHHASLAFFATAWTDAAAVAGCEIMDVLPMEIDPAAIEAAKGLVRSIEGANGKFIEELLDFIEDNANGDYPATAEHFGYYAAMQAMGFGKALRNAFGSLVYDTIKVPYVAFGSYSLERDYF